LAPPGAGRRFPGLQRGPSPSSRDHGPERQSRDGRFRMVQAPVLRWTWLPRGPRGAGARRGQSSQRRKRPRHGGVGQCLRGSARRGKSTS
jgi:hypothetical protein